MKPTINYYRRKIEIITDEKEVAYYYDKLKYVRYNSSKYSNQYCMLYFDGGDEYKVEVSLSELLKNLPPKPFFRCNRQDMINICYCREYSKKLGMVIMEDGAKFDLSARGNMNFQKQKASLKRISPLCQICLDCQCGTCPDLGQFCLPHDHQTEEKNSRKPKQKK